MHFAAIYLDQQPCTYFPSPCHIAVVIILIVIYTETCIVNDPSIFYTDYKSASLSVSETAGYSQATAA